VVNVANASDVPFTANYSAFGSVTGTGLDWMPFGFAGGINDTDTGLVRFGARDFDSLIGRWTSKEPLRFGALHTNFYVYADNDPIGRFDVDGLLVDITYDRRSGKVTVRDVDTGEAATYKAFSGGKPFGDPIPAGWWEVLHREGRPNYWRLDAVDSSPRNDTHDPTGRNRFRLHGPGRSIGCVTAKDGADNLQNWLKAASIIMRTKTVLIRDEINWWGEDIIKYGDLIVE
jgi:RHS repeat-associated protein